MTTSPHDYLVTEGHIDIFELTECIRMGEKDPLYRKMLPRFLSGGIDLVILPAGGDGIHHRDQSERPLVGSLDVLDLFLREVEHSEGHARVVLSNEVHLSRFVEGMLSRGYGEKDVSRFMGGNFLRVLKQVLPAYRREKLR